jgi:hypothetical protein
MNVAHQFLRCEGPQGRRAAGPQLISKSNEFGIGMMGASEAGLMGHSHDGLPHLERLCGKQPPLLAPAQDDVPQLDAATQDATFSAPRREGVVRLRGLCVGGYARMFWLWWLLNR